MIGETKVESVPQQPEAVLNGDGALGHLIKASIDWLLPLGTVILMVAFTMTIPVFLTTENLLAILTQNAYIFLVAVPTAVMLMSGYVDLSIGSILAVAAVAAGTAYAAFGPLLGIVFGLSVGLGFGIANGLMIGYLGWSPIVVTLGFLTFGRGLALFIAPQSVFDFPDAIVGLGAGSLLGVSYLTWISLMMVAGCLVLMRRMPVGRHIVAIGVNRRAAYLAGVNVKRVVFGLYVFIGLAAGLAGVLQSARLNSAPSSSLGLGFELTVLTAVLLGGISFDGGNGSLWRVLLGVWLLAVLQNGITLLNVNPEISQMATGLVLVVAAGLEAARRRLRES